MIFRISQRLNNKIKVGQLSERPLHENTYADWSARLFTADRSQYILLSHTVSLYSVVMFGRGITHDAMFITRALENIRESMTEDGLALIYANFIAPDSSSVRFGKALNRSVIGSMNELVMMAQLHLESGELSPFDVGFKLNQMPLAAIATRGKNYATPREAFSQLHTRSNDMTQSKALSRSNDMPAKNHDTSRRNTTLKPKSRRACGLCGKTKNLTKTQCCGNWICDDEQDYVAFSYVRNSCYRNHDHYTLCGFHHTEGHKGRWQDCAKCRDDFDTETYVHYGTNEYNFETLDNPPAYEPTHCHQCGRVISLGEGGYSISGGDYFCQRCTTQKMGDRFLPPGHDEPNTAHDSTPAQSTPVWMNSEAKPGTGPGGSGPIDLQKLKNEVPEDYQDRFDAIVKRTDTFCDSYLNDEYKQLSREMAASICQSGSPVLKGKLQGWAAGLIYALAQVNVLTDPSQEPHMKSSEIAKGIGVSPSTMLARCKIISQGLDLLALDPLWTLPSRLDDNPLVWMLEINGKVLDIRRAPRDVQVVAYEQGLIPYIPADRVKS